VAFTAFEGIYFAVRDQWFLDQNEIGSEVSAGSSKLVTGRAVSVQVMLDDFKHIQLVFTAKSVRRVIVLVVRSLALQFLLDAI